MHLVDCKTEKKAGRIWVMGGRRLCIRTLARIYVEKQWLTN